MKLREVAPKRIEPTHTIPLTTSFIIKLINQSANRYTRLQELEDYVCELQIGEAD